MHRLQLLVAAFSLGCVCEGLSLAQQPPDKPGRAASAISKSEVDEISTQLGDDDRAKQQAAVDRIKQLLSQNTIVGEDGSVGRTRVNVKGRWLKILLKTERFDEVETLAVQGIMIDSWSTKDICSFQKSRIQAFLAAGKPEAALSAAKAYYNVCPLEDTADAVDLVARALAAARSQEPDIARAFKAQQVALSTDGPTTLPANPDEKNILKAVVVDGKPFEETIKKITSEDSRSQVAKGNLLLLSDNAAEARKCFEAARNSSESGGQDVRAIEGIARSLRAESSSVGPANAYILSQQSR